jgi:hypothetical protein
MILVLLLNHLDGAVCHESAHTVSKDPEHLTTPTIDLLNYVRCHCVDAFEQGFFRAFAAAG